MKKPVLTLGIVLCGNEKYFSYLFESLQNQTYKNFKVLLRDQSKDNQTSLYIKEHHPEILEDDRFMLISGDNRMHSGGHNDLIQKMSGEYYVCGSYDMWYPENFCEDVISAMDLPENKKYGFATVKSMQWRFQDIEDLSLVDSRTNRIDSCGIGITKSHSFYDIGQGEVDTGQFDQTKELFGASGAIVVFRKEALKALEYKGINNAEYFDSLIHYKNDIDISYRLQWAGYKCLFLSDIQVWHDRQVSAREGNMSVVMRIIKNRSTKKRWVKESSFWGQLVMMKKNFSFRDDFSFLVKIKTFIFLAKIFVFITLFEPFLWKQYLNFRQEPSISKKKDHIKKVILPAQIESYMM